VQRANEFITQILSKCGEIVTENVERIVGAYNTMLEKLTKQPRNEQELVELKAYLSENDANLSKMQKEVDCTYQYILMFEEYNFQFGEKNIQDYWYL
jgi:dynein heavy chain